jgi:hypothetical protein
VRERGRDIKKLKRCRKTKVEKKCQEQREGICGRKKCGKLGSYQNKVTQLPVQYLPHSTKI